jgi:hypothetical protein
MAFGSCLLGAAGSRMWLARGGARGVGSRLGVRGRCQRSDGALTAGCDGWLTTHVEWIGDWPMAKREAMMGVFEIAHSKPLAERSVAEHDPRIGVSPALKRTHCVGGGCLRRWLFGCDDRILSDPQFDQVPLAVLLANPSPLPGRLNSPGFPPTGDNFLTWWKMGKLGCTKWLFRSIGVPGFSASHVFFC